MLAKRLFLNSVAGFIDYGVKALTVFILTPLLISTAGPSVYGIWQIILKVTDQLSTLDGRANEVLKWLIAQKQNESDDYKKKAMASCLITWAIFLPIFFLIAGVVIYQMPGIVKAGVEYTDTVILVSIIMVVTAVLAALKSFPGSALYGENIAYKGMGVMAVANVVGGIIGYILIYRNYGIYGMAIYMLTMNLVGALITFYIAKINIPWLGVKKPENKEIKKTFKISIWFTIWAALEGLLVTGDIIILGYFTTPEDVTRYSVTVFSLQTITAIVMTLVAAGMPGIGTVISSGDYEKASKIKSEANTYMWMLGVCIGSVAIFLNESFVALWVGEELYLGDVENLLVILVVIQLMFIRNYAAYINLALSIKEKSLFAAFSFALTILICVYLVPAYGVIGLCVSLLLGRMLLMLAYSRLVNKFMRQHEVDVISIIRMSLTTLFIFYLSLMLKPYFFDYLNVLELIASGILMSIIVPGVVYMIGLNKYQKESLLNRVRVFLPH